MSIFKRSLLARSTLLALTAGALPAASVAETPWNERSGSVMNVNSSYSSNIARDYPLYAEAAGSVLQTVTPGLNFSTAGDNLFAVYARNGGTINVSQTGLSSNGNLSHVVNLYAGNFNMNGGTINVAGTNSNGVNGTNGSAVSLENVTIDVSGDSSGGVKMAQGTLNASNIHVVATGAGSHGIALAHSTFGPATGTLDNVDITLLGAGTRAGLMLGHGAVTGQNVTVSSADRNRGIEVYNAGGANTGVMTLADSRITTDQGDAVYILGGDITLNNAVINTGSGIGVNANRHSTFTMDGGSITTRGNRADGIWVGADDATVDVENLSISTQGTTAHALNGMMGTATVANAELTTTGDNSSGIYSMAQVAGENLSITTQGAHANGITATLEGTVDIKNVELSTAGTGAVGMLANEGGAITANALSVTTAGADAHALWVRGGSANISNAVMSATGADAWGIVASAPTVGTGSTVTLDNVTLSAEQSAAIKTLGAPLNLTLQNKTQITGGNGVLLDSLAGSSSDPAYNGDVNLNATGEVVLTGDIRTATANRVSVALADRSQLTGAIRDIESLTLDNSSLWTLTGDSTFHSFSHEGTVNFTHTGNGFSTLTLESLSGNGGFNMNTDLAGMRGDLIIINGDTSGTHALGIANTGREPDKTDRALTVVATQGGSGQFNLVGGAVDAGTYQYGLEHRGNDWVLAQKHKDAPVPDPTPDPKPDPTPDPKPDPTPDPKPDPTPDPKPDPTPDPKPDPEPKPPVLTPTAKAALNMFNALPDTWYGELSTLRQRMGEVREGNKRGGAWIRMIGNNRHVSPRDDSSYRHTQTGFTVGIDGEHELENGNNISGVLMGYTQSRLDLDNNSDGTINSFYVGGYSTWLLQDGWYIDTVAKANNFSAHTEARMSNGVKTNGGFNTPGFGLSLEAGRQIKMKEGWFAEPSLQLTALWVSDAAYDYDNGLHAESKRTNSQRAALNGVVGRTLNLDNGMMIQPWVRAAVINEFSDNNGVSINGNHFTNDMSGVRAEYGTGLSAQVTPSVQVYADMSYSHSSKSESPLAGNLGARWTW